MTAFALPACPQILLDTDSGFFGDDGVALTMLLRSDRAEELRGITVVSGNVWAREGVGYMARTAKLLGAGGIPVLAGSEAPLLHTAGMRAKESAVGYDGAFGMPLPATEVPGGGVEFLIRTVEANPGRVAILAIGPLTNIAMALRMRPDIATKIATVVILGGNIHVPGNATPKAEFNFWFDPEAAQVVMRSAISNKILFPLDVCNTAKLARATFDRVVAVRTPITDLYREDFGNRYPGFLKDPKVESFLWDELAAAAVADPSVVTGSERALLDVETTFGSAYGAVHPLDKSLAPDATPVTVVTKIDMPRVLDRYVAALTRH